MDALPNDASLRKYYRCTGSSGKIIAMDAPPPESLARFVEVARLLEASGLRVPRIHATDLKRGFCLLEDFGDCLLARSAPGGEPYARASQAIVTLQLNVPAASLPPFDRAFIMRELALFPEWYCAEYRSDPLSDAESESYARVCERLADVLLSQPQAAMHRDFHSRNLFDLGSAIGIIDFQDAVCGPQAYDIASLLRDLYVTIDEQDELDLLVRHYERARSAGLPMPADFGEYYIGYEYASVQRMAKILGLFVRLYRQRGKDAYLQHLPRCAQAAHAAALRYRELRPLALMIEARA